MLYALMPVCAMYVISLCKRHNEFLIAVQHNFCLVLSFITSKNVLNIILPHMQITDLMWSCKENAYMPAGEKYHTISW